MNTRSTAQHLENSIKTSLSQVSSLDKKWWSILIQWVAQFDQYAPDYCDEEKNNTRLLSQLNQIIKKLTSPSPISISDENFADYICRNFEGIYWFAIADSETWDSTTESYLMFKAKHQDEVLDLLISDVPHVELSSAKSWLLAQLK